MKICLLFCTFVLMFSSCGNVNISNSPDAVALTTDPPPPPPPPRPEAAPIVVKAFQSFNKIRIVGSQFNNNLDLTSLRVIYENTYDYSSSGSPTADEVQLITISDLNADGYKDYCLSFKVANGQFANKTISASTGEVLTEALQEHGGKCAQLNNQQQLIQITNKIDFGAQGTFYDPKVKVIQIFNKKTQALLKRHEINVQNIDASYENLSHAEVIEDINQDGFDDLLFSTYKAIPNSFNYKVLTFIISGKTLDTSLPLLVYQSETDQRWMHKIHFSRQDLTAWIDSNENKLTVFTMTAANSYQILRSFDAPQGLYFSQAIVADGHKNKKMAKTNEINLNLCNGKHSFNWRNCDFASFNIVTGEIKIDSLSGYAGHNPEQQKGIFTLSRMQTANDLIGCSSSVIDFNNDIYATQIYSEKNKKIVEHALAPEGFWPTSCFVVREIR